PNCSEPLAELVSANIAKIGEKAIPHMYLLNSHGVLITTGGKDMDGLTALHSALAIVDTVEWNADIAFKQTLMQKLGLLDGYYSKGNKIGSLEDLEDGTPIYNRKAVAVNGD
ncbi:aldolase, partial [Lactobacillus rhamnosus]|nr:aldolase [Lacticaseibacillus rhamnosus]